MSDLLHISGLDSLFRGKAKWNVQRSPTDRTHIFGFQCERLTPALSISDSALEDAVSAPAILARRCIELYERHHRIIPTRDPRPMLTCSHCRAPVDVPTGRQLFDFEFCESQAVKWMERAAAMR